MALERFDALMNDARFFRGEMRRSNATEKERLAAKEQLDGVLRQMKQLRRKMRGEKGFCS